MMYVVRI